MPDMCLTNINVPGLDFVIGGTRRHLSSSFNGPIFCLEHNLDHGLGKDAFPASASNNNDNNNL